MAPSIRVDVQVWEFLQRRAEPFVDTPNTVLRRLLGLDAEEPERMEKKPGADSHNRRTDKRKTRGRRSPTARRRSARPRLTIGPLLPEAEYIQPLLAALVEQGGSAPAREVIAAVGAKLAKKLTPQDRERTQSGAVRWENRAQFVRFRLVEQGLLVRDSPRGVWQLSEAGRAKCNEVN